MHVLTHCGVPTHTNRRTSAAPGPIMADLYPNMKVVPSSSSNLLTKLAEGECDAAVAVKDSFAIQKRLKKYNEDCTMYKTGDVIYPASAGWAVASDSGVKCTSIIRDAIDIYMLEMELQGFIAETKKRWMDLPTTTNHTCVETGADKTSDTTPLGLDRFEGIFIILAVVIFISVAWGFVSKILADRTDKAGDNNDVEVRASVELAPGFQDENGEPPSKIAAEEPGDSSVIKLLEEMRAEMRAEMAEMKTTLSQSHPAAVQSSNVGGQANAKLSPAGNGVDMSHDQPSSAAAFPQEAANQQPKTAAAVPGSVVFVWPWASSQEQVS